MASFLTSSELRRIQLIQLLSRQNDYLSLQELCDKLETTMNTCQSDIQTINELFDQIHIHQTNQGYLLSFNNQYNFQTINAEILGMNLNYSILLYIFHHDACSIEEVADETYTSIATVSRAIQHINKVFKHYKILIQVETNPLHLIGPEHEIRYFFRQVYNILGRESTEEFCEFYETIADLFNVLANQLFDFPISFNQRLNFEAQFYVNYVRVRQGFLMESQNYQPILLTILNYPQAQPVKAFFTNHHLLLDEVTSFRQIFYPFTENPTRLIFSHDLQDQITCDESSIQKTIDFLLDEIQKICTQFQVTLKNPKRVLAALNNYAQLFKHSPRAYYLLLDSLYDYRQLFVENHPSFYQACYQMFERFSKFFLDEINEEFVYYCIDILFLEWSHIISQLNYYDQPIKILIANSISVNQGYFLKNILDYDHCDQISIDVWQQDPDDLTLDIINDYHIIISDFFRADHIKPFYIHITSPTYTVELGHSLRDAITLIRKNRIKHR